MGSTLGRPVTAKHLERIQLSGVLPPWRPAQAGVASMQGYRTTLEDAHKVLLENVPGRPDWAYAAVFDGHETCFAAHMASRHMLRRIAAQPGWAAPSTEPSSDLHEVEAALVSGFCAFDAELRQRIDGWAQRFQANRARFLRKLSACNKLQEEANEHNKYYVPSHGGRFTPSAHHSGTTALVAFITRSHIVTANCGDSRAVLVRGAQAVDLSSDHKPDAPSERARIEALGEEITAGAHMSPARVRGFSCSRALGDFGAKQAIAKPARNARWDPKWKPVYLAPDKQPLTCLPEVRFAERDLASDLYLLLACDGVWDAMSSQEAAVHVLAQRAQGCADPEMLAASLIDEALRRGSKDNLTAVLLQLQPAVPVEGAATGTQEAYQRREAAVSRARDAAAVLTKVHRTYSQPYSMSRAQEERQRKQDEALRKQLTDAQEALRPVLQPALQALDEGCAAAQAFADAAAATKAAGQAAQATLASSAAAAAAAAAAMEGVHATLRSAECIREELGNAAKLLDPDGDSSASE